MDPDPGQSTVSHIGPEAASADARRLDVELVRREDGWPADAREAALIARAARNAFSLAAPGRARAEMSVVLTTDAEMRALNRAWRGRDMPTNVLSFPLDMPAGPAGPRMLGDVVLGFETVAREAAQRGLPRAWHAAHLAVHGLLHLLGHDHATQAQAAAMERMESGVMVGLGLHDPYMEETEVAAAQRPPRGATA